MKIGDEVGNFLTDDVVNAKSSGMKRIGHAFNSAI